MADLLYISQIIPDVLAGIQRRMDKAPERAGKRLAKSRQTAVNASLARKRRKGVLSIPPKSKTQKKAVHKRKNEMLNIFNKKKGETL